MKYIIFDLDGTLALIDHRRYLVEGDKKYWDEFYKQCVHDQPNGPVVAMFNLILTQTKDVVIFSGRSESVRLETIQWLSEHVKTFKLLNSTTALRMRPIGNYEPDEVLKSRWLEELGGPSLVYCVFDDRQKVVDMWRARGIITFQVAPGDF